jgi:transposase
MLFCFWFIEILLYQLLFDNADFILIMDGAGWHKSKDLIIPKNIQIVLLPPYCPELNPVERLWRFIKEHTIKNKVFETLEELENQVCEFVGNLNNEIVKSICSIDGQLES